MRNTSTVARISGLSFSGVSGPAVSLFGSNAYFDWKEVDNDNTGVDYSGSYFAYTGNGFPFVRPPGSSYMAINCINTSSRLIAGCSESFTVTPGRAGLQNLHVWVHAEGVNGRLTVSTPTQSQSADLASALAPSQEERVFTISISPLEHTPRILSLSAPSLFRMRQKQPCCRLQVLRLEELQRAMSQTLYWPRPATLERHRTLMACAHVKLTQQPGFQHRYSLTRLALPRAYKVRSVGLAVGALHLPLGYVSNERIILPNKGCSDQAWISIIADGAKNTMGMRAMPSDYPGGPRSPAVLNWSGVETVVSNDAGNPSPAARAAHHYAFIGVEITSMKSTYVVSYLLVSFNAGAAPTPASISHDIIFQGCYIHRHSSQENSLNGVEFNVDRGGIYDSYIAGFQGNTNSFGNENHAVYFDSTNGPLTFRNNYLSAATECVITGGVPASPFVVTKDIEFDGNFFDKPVALNSQPYPPYDVKNSLEFKQGQFVSITNNVFEHGFAGYGQVGQAIFVRNTTFGGLQRRTTSNYLISNNIIRHHTVGFQLEAYDYFGLGGGNVYAAKVPQHFVPRQYDIKITNNLMEDFSSTKWGAQGRGQGATGSDFFIFNSLPVNLTIDHNTGSFDAATDNAAGYQDGDHSILVQALGTLSKTEGLALTGCQGGYNNAPDEAVVSFVFSSNLLGGGIHGDCYYGTYLLPSAATYSANVFFDVPGYIGNTFISRPLEGLAYTSEIAMPTTGLQGVNPATLPNDCVVMTGNRRDVGCINGQ